MQTLVRVRLYSWVLTRVLLLTLTPAIQPLGGVGDRRDSVATRGDPLFPAPLTERGA